MIYHASNKTFHILTYKPALVRDIPVAIVIANNSDETMLCQVGHMPRAQNSVDAIFMLNKIKLKIQKSCPFQVPLDSNR